MSTLLGGRAIGNAWRLVGDEAGREAYALIRQRTAAVLRRRLGAAATGRFTTVMACPLSAGCACPSRTAWQ